MGQGSGTVACPVRGNSVADTTGGEGNVAVGLDDRLLEPLELIRAVLWYHDGDGRNQRW